jgi:hypothetical protein
MRNAVVVVLACALTPLAGPAVCGAEAPKAKYLTDLSRVQPTSALSQGPREGCWQRIAYVTADEPNVKAGTMVGAASFIGTRPSPAGNRHGCRDHSRFAHG